MAEIRRVAAGRTLIALICLTLPIHPAFAIEGHEKSLLKDWALSRCIARSAPDERAGDDAAKSAGALLERGHVGFGIYEQIEALTGQFLARHYEGSVPSDYNMLKCLDLYHSRSLDRLIGRYVDRP